MTANRATAVVLAVLAAILAVAILRSRGPAPQPANAPASQFSAARAVGVLDSILAGNAPHPIGSAAHDIVRDRVVAQLQRLGYDATLQRTFACNAHATCAPVANILAKLPGDARADTLMLSAHYDSVPAGPGASDDGIGVATILEVARAVRSEHFRNTILFLITDGEEDGLLGAEGFVADPNLSRGVAAVINVDNRGTAGRSYLFETSRHNRWLLPLIARSLPRPSASSFYYNMYELLPNDTDMTVFKRAGIAGINFGNIANVAYYHTPLDDLQHVSASTVQDHGDHVLGMTRALANTDLRQSTDDDAVFFDVMSFGTLWWPQRWTLWMAIAALVVLLFGAVMQIRDAELTASAVTAGVASFFLSVIAAAILGGVIAWLGTSRAPTAIWLAQAGPIQTAMWLIGAATAMVCAASLYLRGGFDGLFIGHALCWIAMSVALSAALPGGAYLALVPAIAFALCTILRATLDLSEAASVIITSAVTAVVWFPLIIALYDLIGRPSLGVIATMVALVATTATPFIAANSSMRRATVPAMYTAAIVCVAMQLLLPAFNPQWPRAIDVQYAEDDAGAVWLVDGLTPKLRSVAHFLLAPRDFIPWTAARARVYTAPAARLHDPQPDTVATRNGAQVHVVIRSMRNAPRVTMIYRAPEVMSVRINGVRPPQQRAKFPSGFAPGWQSISVRGAPEAQVDIVLRRDEPVDAIVSDTSFDVPPAAAPIVRARNESIAVPSNSGDTTVVRRRLRF
ncbi:MAG TPA: M20/M25/M40 family metallo-hydrolase [Thermoanaerobaculia bacterium]|nr:M20/M25/M40 family metallo-hydrolase [Thermoanaerobaculia bacterium]